MYENRPGYRVAAWVCVPIAFLFDAFLLFGSHDDSLALTIGGLVALTLAAGCALVVTLWLALDWCPLFDSPPSAYIALAVIGAGFSATAYAIGIWWGSSAGAAVMALVALLNAIKSARANSMTE